MQNIFVNVATHKDCVTFNIDGKCLAEITQLRNGKYAANTTFPALHKHYNTLPEAIEIVGDNICQLFEPYGVNVMFN